CTHSKYDVVTPPELARMSGMTKTPLSWRYLCASGVVGPFAPSVSTLAWICGALSMVIWFSSAAGIRTSTSSPQILSCASGSPPVKPSTVLLCAAAYVSSFGMSSPFGLFFFFKQKTAYEIGLGIPAEPLFRSPCLNCLEAVKKPPPVAFKVMCLLPITILYAWVMLVLNLPFKALMFLTLMRPFLVLFLVLWLKLVKDFLKVRCRLALLPFLISCLIWLDLVASLPLIKERILVIILLLHFLSLMLGSVLVLLLPLLVWLTPEVRIKNSLLNCNWTIRKRLPRCKMR